MKIRNLKSVHADELQIIFTISCYNHPMENINRLYVLNTDIFDDTTAFNEAYAQMDHERKKKIDAFKYPKDKKLSLGAGFLLKKGLAEIGITDFEIIKGSNEKPYLDGFDNVFFNLSHSGNMVALGLSDKEIGVDIENIRNFRESLVNYVFSLDEQDMAKELVCSQNLSPNETYTRLWTAKESIMKYSGMGITLEPKKIVLSLRKNCPDPALMLFASSEALDLGSLTLSSYDIPDYQLTVCSEYRSFELTRL